MERLRSLLVRLAAPLLMLATYASGARAAMVGGVATARARFAAAPSLRAAVVCGRRRRFSAEKKEAQRVPRVMRLYQDGEIPEVARCYPERYDELLGEKVAAFETLLANSTQACTEELPSTEVFTSEPLNFRMRATFNVWRTDEGADFVMYNQGDSRTPHQVLNYPMGSLRMNELMPVVREQICKVDELRERINDVSFLTTTTGEALVAITYNRPIENEVWGAAAADLAAAMGSGVRVIGRSRKVKIVVGDDTVKETLHVTNRGACTYKQAEGAFTQPNAKVCEKMLSWAYKVTAGGDKNNDLCELYCGNGCFTVALAPNFRKVIATELSKASVALAEENLAINNVRNVRVARLSAEEFVEAYSGTRRFHRLKEAKIELGANSGLKMKTLFVDPPRAGLDEVCRNLASTFDRVVYVSCNPVTLGRDLAELTSSHAVTHVACFDQFPYTPHLECGVVLQRRA